jgi:ADP-ribosyltransferase exoenzyme
MCYARPGPRCSSHAAQALAKAQIACEESMFSNPDRATIERTIKRRDKALAEFNATPVGLAILQSQVTHGTGYEKERSELDLAQAKALREYQLSAIAAEDRGDTGSHAGSRLHTLYENLGLSDEFDTTTADRVGWDNGTEIFSKNSKLLTKASSAWVDNMSPEQSAAIAWVTGAGSEILSRHAHGVPQTYYGESYTNEQLEERARLVNEAFDAAPRMPKPVVLYRGIGSGYPFDPEEVIQEGHYTAKSILSASVNPGVANSFGYKNVILEMKTRRFASPVNISGVGPREAEVMIKPGSRFKVTGVLRDVSFGWSKENMVDGYTVIQMEEVEDIQP